MRALPRFAIGSAAAAIGVGGLVFVLSRPPVAGPGSAGAPAPIAAAAAPANPRPHAEERGFLGVIVAGESVDVAARMSGLVTGVRVRLGDAVAQGGILASLDDRPLRDELAMAQAGVRAALSAAQKAKLELEESRERLDRWQRTAEAAVVSPEELAGMRYKAQYAAHELEAANARVAEQQARVKDLERQIAEATVRAPFAGQVAARYVDAGATVQPGQPIVRLVRAGELRVRFAVPEHRGARILHGMAVEVTLDRLPDELDSQQDAVLTGVVENVAPEVDAASRMIIAEARLEVPQSLAQTTLAGRVGRVRPRPGNQPPASGAPR